MAVLDLKYPGYEFATHKGYGTPGHQEALKKNGPCDLHRRSFAPVAELVAKLAKASIKEAAPEFDF